MRLMSALFVDQAYPDARGKAGIIPGWVNTFGDRVFTHVTVWVEDIEGAVVRTFSQPWLGSSPYFLLYEA